MANQDAHCDRALLRIIGWCRGLSLLVAASVTVGCNPLPVTPTPRSTEPSAPRLPLSTMPTMQASSGADGIGDPYYPQLGNAGYDVQQYQLDLAVDLSSPQHTNITATVTITAQATQDLSAFNLDFLGLTIEGITVDSVPARYQRLGRELTITPTTMLTTGTSFRVIVAYHGEPERVPSEIQGGMLQGNVELGWHRYDNGSYVFNEPSGAATWFPVNDHPRDKATYAFAITVAKPYVAVANGLLRETRDHGTTVTYFWESSAPMASYLATVNIAKQVIETTPGPDGVVIRHIFPLDFSATNKRVLAQTSEMLTFFAQRFGPYPFEAYGVVVADTDITAFVAMEHQTLALFGNNGYILAEDIVVHELAHQWFGNSVSVDSWQDVWLKEGFATYAEWLWREHTDGSAARDALIRDVYAHPEQHWSSYPPVARPDPQHLLNWSVYKRGALTLHALRHRVGDERFFRILQTYTEQHRGRTASTADFITLAEAISEQDLDAFFDTWLYTETIPPLKDLGL